MGWDGAIAVVVVLSVDPPSGTNSLARLVLPLTRIVSPSKHRRSACRGCCWVRPLFFSLMLRNPVESDSAPIASSPLRPDAVSETAALAATGRRSWGLLARRLRCCRGCLG